MIASSVRGSERRHYGEVLQLAQNLGRNCGYACFPCAIDKRPTLKGWPERASTDANAIERLWRDHPGALIGIVCGERSGIDILDLDAKHDEARAWWHRNYDRLPATRCYRTRSGGAHFYFKHVVGLRNSAGKIVPGLDVRAEGGYCVSWWCAGLPCLDHSPIAPWPAWLLKLILPPPAVPASSRQRTALRSTDAAITGILRAIADATEGNRNSVLNWAAYRMGERVTAGNLSRRDAESLLIGAALAAGLTRIEANRTIASGLKGAGA
jgi:hypothetical protein